MNDRRKEKRREGRKQWLPYSIKPSAEAEMDLVNSWWGEAPCFLGGCACSELETQGPHYLSNWPSSGRDETLHLGCRWNSQPYSWWMSVTVQHRGHLRGIHLLFSLKYLWQHWTQMTNTTSTTQLTQSITAASASIKSILLLAMSEWVSFLFRFIWLGCSTVCVFLYGVFCSGAVLSICI